MGGGGMRRVLKLSLFRHDPQVKAVSPRSDWAPFPSTPGCPLTLPVQPGLVVIDAVPEQTFQAAASPAARQ